MVKLSITLDEGTNALSVEIPANPVLALGMIDYLHEAVLARVVRPQFEQHIVAPPTGI